MGKTFAKTGFPTNMEKHVYILCSIILHWPTLQITSLLNENKRIYAQMHKRDKPEMYN